MVNEKKCGNIDCKNIVTERRTNGELKKHCSDICKYKSRVDKLRTNNPIGDPPLCICGTKITKSKKSIWNTYCSTTCSNKTRIVDPGIAPKCLVDGCENIISKKKNCVWLKYCSPECRKKGVPLSVKNTCMERYGVTNGSMTSESKDKRVLTCLEKYEVTNPSYVQEFLDKIIETNVERYDTDRPQLLDKFQQKTKDSNIEKYGVEKPQQLQDFKDRSEETCIERYGVSAPQQNKEIQQKSIDTCIERYGVSNVSKLESVWNKIRNTCIQKYGFPSSNQDPDVHRKQDAARYRNKEYIFEDGKIILLQGYEPWAIDILVADGYLSNDIETETKYIPRIIYHWPDGTLHRYFPDVYIQKDNLIIEVKSTYTYELAKSINLLKRQACLDAGYNFEFMIFDGKGNLIAI